MSISAELAALLACLAFAAVHVFGRRLRFLEREPRSRWLSLAGGAAVSYVFVLLLPELGARQQQFQDNAATGLLGTLDRHLYLVALAGLVAFYGLERMARKAAAASGGAELADCAPGVFRVHLASYAAYNVLIGYLLVHPEELGGGSQATFAIAMALHFLVNDHALRAHHGAAYHRYGRWVLAAAPLLGWAFGLGFALPQSLLSLLFAVLAGGIVLNVLKDELPSERESSFAAFAAGAAGYTLLLLAV